MYKKIKWPVFAHQLGRCFNCNGALDGVPKRTVAIGLGGEWQQYCRVCDMQTFYDTPRPGNPGILDGDNAKGAKNV